MITVFALNTPWMVIGFWNAVIGFSLLHFKRDWLPSVTGLAGLEDETSAIGSRTAIIMPVHNESPDLVVGNLTAVRRLAISRISVRAGETVSIS